MQPVFIHRLQVRFRDCDPMGHVNNAVYLTYLEQARFNHWRASGIADLREQPDSAATPAAGSRGVPGVILARAEIDYRRPATYGDTLDVVVGIAAIGRTSFTYEYEIRDTQGQVVATARTVLVAFDYAAGRPVPLTAAQKDALARDVR